MATQRQCSTCEATLTCSADIGCWCNDLPQVLLPNPTANCMCKACLIRAIATVVNTDPSHLTEKQKVAITELGPVTDAENKVDYYMENSLLVMTAWYHLRRGSCCKNGCRNCPYK